MPADLVIEVTVHDQELYTEYAKQVPAVLENTAGAT